MTIVGRMTKDAVVNQLKDERQVVNFSIAVNDYYKPKNEEGVQLTTYYNCSYWISTKIVINLKKGTLVEVTGRIYVTAYAGADRTAKVSLNCPAVRPFLINSNTSSSNYLLTKVNCFS